LADIEDAIWKKYKNRGLVLWAIGGDSEGHEELLLFKHQMGLTYPILYDDQMAIQFEFYKTELALWSPYPQDFVIGVDGTIRYVNNKVDSQELIMVIEEEIEKLENSKR
jgi:peroxiredoxin